MVGTSKILTVSYGTFSCTLEGFDDPFSTMRSIAEYFRDLAAEDRYFGAEPPQPDAEMLHRIAENEIQQRVEARVADNSVHLRQLEDDTAPAPVATFEEMDEQFEELVEAEDAAPVDLDAGESVAEKLSRIRAVVSKSRDAEEDAELSTNEPVAEDAPAEWQEEPEANEALRAEADEIGMAVAADDADTDDADDMAAAVAAFVAAEDDQDADESADFAPSQEQDTEYEGETAVEDDQPVSFAEETPEEVSEDLTLEETDDEGEAPEAEIIQLAQEPVEDFGVAEEFSEEAQPEAMAETSEEEGDDFEAPDVLTEEFSEEDAENDALVAFDAPEAQDEETAEVETDVESETAEADIDPVWDDTEEDTVDSDDDFAASARAAMEREIEVEVEDEDLAAGIRAAIGGTSLDDEEEDDLMEEIAEAERVDAIVAASRGEFFDEDEDEAIDEASADTDDGEDVSPGMLAARARLGDLADAEDASSSDVERLMDETDSKMEDSEGSRRRSAIAHLKAAVAATKADRLLKRVTKREANEAEEQEQYREDLSAVVRPKRPEVRNEATERPKLDEPAAPLMLVSELRVDEQDDDTSDVTPIAAVRPRRVSSDQEDGQAGSESADKFAEFAAQMDAHELPDLLEAAAAYSAFVEGNPHFSRPQLMKRVARYDTQAEFTREAGLRSFGQLLRQGKIQKLKRGQFTIAETTRFNPDARIAGE